MKITLEQSGGLAGVQPPRTLDTATLGEARAELEGLARTVSGQASSRESVHPEEMGYILTIVADDGTREVRGTDSGATPGFLKLVQEVRKRGRIGAV